MDAFEEADDAINKSLRFYVPDITGFTILSYNISVTPVIQVGPTCGLAALKMAGQIVNDDSPSLEDILEKAKSLGYTAHGEMFSCSNMADLAKFIYRDIFSFTIENINDSGKLIVENILKGHPILIPYDSDKNHHPCLKHGLHAHWAIITGVCFVIPTEKAEGVYDSSQINHVNNGSELLGFFENSTNILLYARHGKSKRLVVWELQELLQSNANLEEFDINRHSVSYMVIPEENPLGGLRNQAVCLYKL